MRVGLGGQQVTPRRLARYFGGAAVGGDIAAALPDREPVNFGGPFVRGAGRAVPIHRALTCHLVPLVCAVGVLGGTLDVLLRNGPPGGEFSRRSGSYARCAASSPGETATK
ncbi:hypothetical protein [Mycobacterium interjectum]|uniref:hypothetical protein n=1 Tax=Mycobacterium interjectum TaxID=33895 RepID=UPI0021F29CB8|nr:hypothetical protein [Mycobacterium interjectum]MCV7090353.1 hypothetical protein [Mycobacterium interjectum]